MPLMAIFGEIKKGRWKGETDTLRAVRGMGLSDKAASAKEKGLKRKLPTFMMSASTSTDRHRKADCARHTGVIQLDVDGIGAEAALELRDRLGDDPHILAAWISPRGNGVKIAVRVSATLDTHDMAWRMAAGYAQANLRCHHRPGYKGHQRALFCGVR